MRTPSRTLPLVLLLALCLAGPGCGSDDAVEPAGPDVYHVTQERNGQTIRLAVGQPLAVVLPSIAGSASRWTPQDVDAGILRQTSGTRTVGGRHGGMIIGGSKGYEKLLFEPLRPGATRLRLTRVRTPAEGGGTVAFQIDVIVEGATQRR